MPTGNRGSRHGDRQRQGEYAPDQLDCRTVAHYRITEKIGEGGMGAYIEATTTASSATLIKDAADARYVSTGHLVFPQQGTFMALPLDLEKLQLTGQLVPVISDVVPAFNIRFVSRETAAGPFSISDSGALVYSSGGNLSYVNRRRLAL